MAIDSAAIEQMNNQGPDWRPPGNADANLIGNNKDPKPTEESAKSKIDAIDPAGGRKDL